MERWLAYISRIRDEKTRAGISRSAVECLLGMQEALDSMPGTA